MGLGFAAFGAELPELEARCHEHLHYARPTVLAATEDPQGTRVLNLFARDCLQGGGLGPWTSQEVQDPVQGGGLGPWVSQIPGSMF